MSRQSENSGNPFHTDPRQGAGSGIRPVIGHAAAPKRYENSMLSSALVLARETPVSRRAVHHMRSNVHNTFTLRVLGKLACRDGRGVLHRVKIACRISTS